jgi:hypothetical protein
MTYHVIATLRKGWAVRKFGSRRATKVYPSKAEAIEDAKRRGSVVYVHREDGMVERKIET